MEHITGIVNSLKRISRKVQLAITLNELDLKTLLQIDIAIPNHVQKR
jgi:hypothetical protein